MQVLHKRLPMALALAALVTVALATMAFAGEGDRPAKRLVVSGTITEVTPTEGGRMITIDRGGENYVQVLLTEDTQIEPPGAQPAVGVLAKAIVLPLEGEASHHVALHLVLKVPPAERKARACGTITALPEDPHHGIWTIDVPEVGPVDVLVTPDTKITPPDVAPALDGRACVNAYRSDTGGWVARQVQLKEQPQPKPEPEERPAKLQVELRGTVVGDPPATPPDEWPLIVAVEGIGELPVVITPDTEIQGTLADGARVAARVSIEPDGGTGVRLVALRVKVLGEPSEEPGKDPGKGNVRFEGVVTEVDGPVWTLVHDEETFEIRVTEETKIVGLAPGASIVGQHVEGNARRLEDGSLVATMVRFK